VKPAPLTKMAKNILCQRGPEIFKKVFGDYYIAGYQKGAEMFVEVTVDSYDTDTKSTVSTELRNSFNTFG